MNLKSLLLWAAALLASPVLVAAPAQQIVVLPISVASGIDSAQASVLDDILLTELTRRSPASVKIIGSKDLVNLIDHEQQKQLLGCTDSSCLIEIGNALGASHLISSSVGRIGKKIVVSSTLLDVSDASVVHRETLYLSGDEEDLIPAMESLAQSLASGAGWHVVASGSGSRDSSPLLWSGATLAGLGLAATGGLGTVTWIIDQGLDPQKKDYKAQGALGLGALMGTGLGVAALVAGGVLITLASVGE